jgi:hypothetical protein
MLSVNIFSLIFNEVLISLYRCLDSTHTNYPTAMCGYSTIYYMAIPFILYAFDNQGFHLDIAEGSDR